MLDFNFSVESPSSVKEKLSKGYRGRRNFLVGELLSMIIFGTPVKDGFARGGWRVTVGAVGEQTDERTADKDGTTTWFKGLVSLKGASPFKDVHIYNTVSYIDELERGSSRQAPEGMVRVSLSAFKSMYGDVL